MPPQKRLGTAELLFKAAQRLGLSPAWIVPNGLFAIVHNGAEKYINQSHSALNTHSAISLARNKQLTRLILGRHNLPNIPFMRPKNHDEATAFLTTFGKIIAKPLKGSGSRDIHIITDATQLNQLTINTYILEQYIVGAEMRYLVMDGTVIAVHRSEYGTSVAADRYLERYSLHRADWHSELVNLSVHITAIMGLNFAAIDYLVGETGKHYILEVNSAPGLKWFHAPTEGPSVDVATPFVLAAAERHQSHSHPDAEVSFGIPANSLTSV